MPRYFFHIQYEGEPESRDTEGIELANEQAAWSEATGACGQMIQDIDGSFQVNTDWRIDVADQRGATLFRLTFRGERLGSSE